MSLASDCKCSSCPSSQARRDWRPAIVALTWDMALLVQVEDRLNRGDRGIQPLTDFTIGRLQPAGAGRLAIQCGGQSRAINTQCLDLGNQALFVAVGLLATFDCTIKRVERERQTLD